MIDFNDAGKQGAVFEDAEDRRARISGGLKNRIRDLVKYLYPKAVFSGQDARIGDVSGARGSSLSIALAPYDKAGMWIDHAEHGERGDALALWARVHSIDIHRDFARVLTECEAWLGGSPPAAAQARHEIEAAKPAEPEPTKELEHIYVYRSAEGEKLCEIRRYRLSNGEKTFLPITDGVPRMPDVRPLYGLDKWKEASRIVIVEGEKCVDALDSIGVHATSAMGGSGTDIAKTDWAPLSGREILLWPDNDSAGRNYMDRLFAHLVAAGQDVRIIPVPEAAKAKWDAADAVEEGVNIQALLKVASTSSHGLRGYWLEEIAYAYEPELVEGLIPAHGVGVVYGPSSAGKSFVTVDWAMTIASGGKVLNRFTEAVGVLYFAAEGQAGLRKRLVAVRQARDMDDVVLPFNYLPALLDLSRAETGDIERLCLYAQEASVEMALRGRALRVVIVDTLAAAAPSADENAQKDMGPVMLAFHRMAQRLDAVVILVAHTGKDITRGLRGWSGIRANADFAIECRVDKDEETGETTRRSLWFEKCKDGPDGFVLADYVLRQVKLGVKRSSEPDTTCIVDWQPPQLAVQKAVRPYSGPLQRIIDMLQNESKTTIEVAAELGVDRSNAGKKLRKLEQDGAIFTRDDGPRKIWVLCNDGLPSSKQ
jgi:hypothetical protein